MTMLKTSNDAYIQIQSLFHDNKHWGLSSTLDLSHCDPQIIRSESLIKKFVIELCDLIDMKRFGDTQVVHFGDDDEKVAGYSMVQLIQTSLISGHFANKTNHVYLDIFSCKIYDPYTVERFGLDFFKAVSSKLTFSFR